MNKPPEKLYWTYPCGLDTEWDLVIEKRNPLVFRYVYGVHSIPGELGLLLLKQRKSKMKIETEHNIGETVYYMHENRINQGKVNEISAQTNGRMQTVKYLIHPARKISTNQTGHEVIEEMTAKTPNELALKLVNRFKPLPE